jgi:hypothetical protein
MEFSYKKNKSFNDRKNECDKLLKQYKDTLKKNYYYYYYY